MKDSYEKSIKVHNELRLNEHQMQLNEQQNEIKNSK